jgi:hypothetical protein
MFRTCIADIYCLVCGCVTLLDVSTTSVQSMDVIHTLTHRISLSDLYAHDELGARNEVVGNMIERGFRQLVDQA